MKKVITRALFVIVPAAVLIAALHRPVQEQLERRDHIAKANFYSPTSPAHEAYAQFLGELYEYPAYQRATSGAATPLSIHRLTHQFAMEGLGRLSDAELEQYMAIRREIWEKASVELCAAYTRGDPRADDIFQNAKALEALTRDQIETYFRLEAMAAKAEITNSQPKRKLGEGATAEAGSLFYAAMTDAERERFLQAMEDIGEVPDEEACWAGRLYNAVPFRAEGEARRSILRMLVQ